MRFQCYFIWMTVKYSQYTNSCQWIEDRLLFKPYTSCCVSIQTIRSLWWCFVCTAVCSLKDFLGLWSLAAPQTVTSACWTQSWPLTRSWRWHWPAVQGRVRRRGGTRCQCHSETSWQQNQISWKRRKRNKVFMSNAVKEFFQWNTKSNWLQNWFGHLMAERLRCVPRGLAARGPKNGGRENECRDKRSRVRMNSRPGKT